MKLLKKMLIIVTFVLPITLFAQTETVCVGTGCSIIDAKHNNFKKDLTDIYMPSLARDISLANAMMLSSPLAYPYVRLQDSMIIGGALNFGATNSKEILISDPYGRRNNYKLHSMGFGFAPMFFMGLNLGFVFEPIVDLTTFAVCDSKTKDSSCHKKSSMAQNALNRFDLFINLSGSSYRGSNTNKSVGDLNTNYIGASGKGIELRGLLIDEVGFRWLKFLGVSVGVSYREYETNTSFSIKGLDEERVKTLLNYTDEDFFANSFSLGYYSRHKSIGSDIKTGFMFFNFVTIYGGVGHSSNDSYTELKLQTTGFILNENGKYDELFLSMENKSTENFYLRYWYAGVGLGNFVVQGTSSYNFDRNATKAYSLSISYTIKF